MAQNEDEYQGKDGTEMMFREDLDDFLMASPLGPSDIRHRGCPTANKRRSIRKVERWEAYDGSLHLTEYEAKKHNTTFKHECPKCSGLGRVNGKPINKHVIDHEASGWAGWHSDTVTKEVTVGYEQDTCDVCGGEGWTQEKKKPITKTHTEILGYK